MAKLKNYDLYAAEADEGKRVDKFLTEKLPSFTRSRIQNMIKSMQVRINNEIGKANRKLKKDDKITLSVEEAKPADIIPEDIPLDILYEDSDIIVVNKAKGMVVHPAVGNYSHTLVNALLYHCHDLSGINGVLMAGIVHRLDKDTSGLLVVCKNDLAHNDLALQFAKREVEKVYQAVVSGVIPHNKGVIDAPIGRSPKYRQMMTVKENGKAALTYFKVLKRFRQHTLIEVKIATGRTHQIRVHMQYIGFPVLGDSLYGSKKEAVKCDLMLHAEKLSFIHPRTKEKLSFTKDVPDSFKAVLQSLM